VMQLYKVLSSRNAGVTSAPHTCFQPDGDIRYGFQT
jgi:hypothetical protein